MPNKKIYDFGNKYQGYGVGQNLKVFYDRFKNLQEKMIYSRMLRDGSKYNFVKQRKGRRYFVNVYSLMGTPRIVHYFEFSSKGILKVHKTGKDENPCSNKNCLYLSILAEKNIVRPQKTYLSFERITKKKYDENSQVYIKILKKGVRYFVIMNGVKYPFTEFKREITKGFLNRSCENWIEYVNKLPTEYMLRKQKGEFELTKWENFLEFYQENKEYFNVSNYPSQTNMIWSICEKLDLSLNTYYKYMNMIEILKKDDFVISSMENS